MIKGVLLDLDGTVYHGTRAVPGAARFVGRMSEIGVRCLYVTNRSNRSPETVAEHLSSLGMPCEPQDVLTTAHATARYLKPGRVFYIGEAPLGQALEKAGHIITEESPDYVVLSYDREINYTKLEKATRLVRAGAQFIGTNPDKFINKEEGISPGTGAFLEVIKVVTEQEPVIIGKPQRLIVDIALETLGMNHNEVIMVGDNLETDVLAGCNAGVRSVLILTGVSKREDIAASPCEPTWVVEDFAELEKLVEEL